MRASRPSDALDREDVRQWPATALGRLGWPGLDFTALESIFVVFGSLWLLRVAQQRLDRPVGWVGPRVSRSAYGAFMLQGIFLIGLAFAMRPLPLPAELKALLLAVTAVLASFVLAWLLISRIPGLKRVL